MTAKTSNERACELLTERDEALANYWSLRASGNLLSAEIACGNGCKCENNDYCAQDEWWKALRRIDAVRRP